MKKLLIVGAVALSLGGCAGLGQKLDTAFQIITSASVSPTQIVVIGNTFDGLESTATQYLTYCQANKAISVCAVATRQKVVAAVRAGRAARNQLEPYVTSGTAGPAAIYNTLSAAVTQLQSFIPATTGAK